MDHILEKIEAFLLPPLRFCARKPGVTGGLMSMAWAMAALGLFCHAKEQFQAVRGFLQSIIGADEVNDQETCTFLILGYFILLVCLWIINRIKTREKQRCAAGRAAFNFAFRYLLNLIEQMGRVFFESSFALVAAFAANFFQSKTMMIVALFSAASIISFMFACILPEDFGFLDLCGSLALGFAVLNKHHWLVYLPLCMAPVMYRRMKPLLLWARNLASRSSLPDPPPVPAPTRSASPPPLATGVSNSADQNLIQRSVSLPSDQSAHKGQIDNSFKRV